MAKWLDAAGVGCPEKPASMIDYVYESKRAGLCPSCNKAVWDVRLMSKEGAIRKFDYQGRADNYRTMHECEQ